MRHVLIILLMIPTLVHAQTETPRQRVAVLELGNPAGLDRQEITYLTEIVRGVARNQLPSSRFTIMTRENITDLLGDRALADCQGDCVVETGRNLGAAYVVAGEVSLFAGELRVALSLHETKTSDLIINVRIRATDVKGLEGPLETEVGKLFQPLRPRETTTTGGTEGRLGDDTTAWTSSAGADVVVGFESDPPGATVEIDGTPVCVTPCSRPLPPGPVEVAFKLVKYVPWSQLIEIKDGLPTVKAQLEANFGWLTVRTTPAGLKVELDAEALGPSPITRREVALGAHEIWVREPYFKATGEKVVIERGEHAEVIIVPVPINGGLKVQAVDRDGNAVSADVLVDGAVAGRTWAILTVQAGPHRVEVRSDTGRWSDTITVPAESVLAQDVTMGAATNSVGMTMMQIEPGRFFMGSPQSETDRESDEAQHEVTLTRPFLMSATEVTQGQWEAVMGSNPSNFKGSKDLPVENVSWYNCVEFCNKLSAREGLTPAYTIQGTDVSWNRAATGYRLPTEAEWEYACRAGTRTKYNFGDRDADLGRAGRYDSNSGSKTHPVGAKTANAWSLYDMHGNVWEWCWDWYGEYPTGGVNDPAGPGQGANRVLRGGSWLGEARYCRSANRNYCDPGLSYSNIGFRVLAGSAGQ
jgi:formylglycine-generating enzyme required for sulfatase activity